MAHHQDSPAPPAISPRGGLVLVYARLGGMLGRSAGKLSGGEVRMERTPAELSGRPDFVEPFLGGRGAAAAPSGDS